jgi:hypothetical protein
VAMDEGGFIAVDGLGAIIAHPVGFIVLHLDALVFLGVQPDFLFALLVFESQRIGVGG